MGFFDDYFDPKQFEPARGLTGLLESLQQQQALYPPGKDLQVGLSRLEGELASRQALGKLLLRCQPASRRHMVRKAYPFPSRAPTIFQYRVFRLAIIACRNSAKRLPCSQPNRRRTWETGLVPVSGAGRIRQLAIPSPHWPTHSRGLIRANLP
jgi:hypothetical protein